MKEVCGLDDGVVVSDHDIREEAGVVKGREMSRKPSLKEVDDHNATHLPFRSWCPICVAARAKNYSHKDREYTEGSKEVHYDYCFLRNNKGGDFAPVLVSKSRPHK